MTGRPIRFPIADPLETALVAATALDRQDRLAALVLLQDGQQLAEDARDVAAVDLVDQEIEVATGRRLSVLAPQARDPGSAAAGCPMLDRRTRSASSVDRSACSSLVSPGSIGTRRFTVSATRRALPANACAYTDIVTCGLALSGQSAALGRAEPAADLLADVWDGTRARLA